MNNKSYCPGCGRPDVVVSLNSTLLEIRPEVRSHACRVGSYGSLTDEEWHDMPLTGTDG